MRLTEIASGVRGTIETLQAMRTLAGGGRPWAEMSGPSIDPRSVERRIREIWTFRPEPIETIKSPWAMWREWNATGKIQGDCDDAAILAACMMARNTNWKNAFVAVRLPNGQFFSHVFLLCWDPAGWVNIGKRTEENVSGWSPARGILNCPFVAIDPTVTSANYDECETLIEPGRGI